MFPISDDNTDRHLTPVVNYVFIAVNIAVFIFLQGMGSNIDFTYAFATVPAEIIKGVDMISDPQIITDPGTGRQFQVPGLQPTPIHPYLTLISSMFMHGGWGHLGGNMLFLWIFGDNIENRLGHLRYFIFYIATGVVASLSHVMLTFMMAESTIIPSLGASGAISGVMGAYIILFPKRKVNVLLLRFIVPVPAFVALGFWIAFQIFSGFNMLSGGSDGVAYAAHIGGFLAGMLLIKLFDKGQNYVDDQLLKRNR